MLFYEMTLKMSRKNDNGEDLDRAVCQEFNKRMSLDGTEGNGEIIRAASLDGGTAVIICSFRHNDFSERAAAERVGERLKAVSEFGEFQFINMKEITARDAMRRDSSDIFTNGFSGGYGRCSSALSLDYFSNHFFSVEDYICPAKRITRKAAETEAAELMLGDDFKAEMKRIFSRKNRRKFYGNPVHYRIMASKPNAGREIADLLARMLIANGRLVGSRVTVMHSIQQNCVNEEEMESLFSAARGTAVVIDLSGIGAYTDDSAVDQCYADPADEDAEFIAGVAAKYADDTLCIFVESEGKSPLARALWRALPESMKMIELHEGAGSRSETAARVERLIRGSGMADFMPKNSEALLPPNETAFTLSDAERIFTEWRASSLRSVVYGAYDDAEFLEIAKDDGHAVSEARDTLEKMIGLEKVKAVTDRIVAAHKIGAMRKLAGIDAQTPSRHMVFTGNPGTAKTTVARLLAAILKKESAISTGVFVECGRADLVGRYVGWTAKTVKEKFQKANGGVLFIDEAYALADDSRSFGEEAINTIVQEMENARGKVLVIFAGYPDKMKEFLDRNEGLRSRVAFHLDFPDYTVDELTDILRLMAEDRRYSLTDGAEAKCRSVFERAVRAENFGNGRFVRNMLEQAVINQSARLMKTYSGSSIPPEELELLTEDDFDEDISVGASVNRKVGFAA